MADIKSINIFIPTNGMNPFQTNGLIVKIQQMVKCGQQYLIAVKKILIWQ